MKWWFPFIKRKPVIDRSTFFHSARQKWLFKHLTQDQVDSIETIFDHWDRSGYTDKRWLAYMFATVYHETAKTMLPIEEYGKGRNHTYGEKIKHSGIHYQVPDKIYYGRGYVQLTWYENYELMGRLLKIDLLTKPELALVPNVAAQILFEGMTKGSSSFGDFTGKCLEQYINDHLCDYISARKIINGSDKAVIIAQYARDFEGCIVIS